MEQAEVITGGDKSAANSEGALMPPVLKWGACCYCLLYKTEGWLDPELAAACPRRVVAQCVLNHVNPFPLLGIDAPPPMCPCCCTVLTEQQQSEQAQRRAGMSAKQLKQEEGAHAKRCRGGRWGQRPVVFHDSKRRAPSALHTRMNMAQNLSLIHI